VFVVHSLPLEEFGGSILYIDVDVRLDFICKFEMGVGLQYQASQRLLVCLESTLRTVVSILLLLAVVSQNDSSDHRPVRPRTVESTTRSSCITTLIPSRNHSHYEIDPVKITLSVSHMFLTQYQQERLSASYQSLIHIVSLINIYYTSRYRH
jgi:hypothetical protein